MAMRNILVHVDADERSAATVKAALSVARRFDARLSGFFVVPDIAMAAATPGGAMMNARLVEEMQAEADREAEIAEKIFRDVADAPGKPAQWTSTDAMGKGTRAAATTATLYADLIVAGGCLDEVDRGTRSVYPQDLVVDSGRPLLLVPLARTEEVKIGKILVAWSESREAARAVFDALPFLELAESVNVATVMKDKMDSPAPAEKIARTLADRGVTASVDTVLAEDGQTTSAALFEHAARTGAELLVAGAYSHSRLREGLFGGVTKSIFDSSPLPALLSH